MTSTYTQRGRRLFPIAFIGTLAFLLLALAASASAAKPQAEETGRYVVILKDSVSHPGNVADAQTEQRDGELGFVYRHAFNGYSAVLPKDEVAALRRDPRVETVAVDQKAESFAQTTPTGVGRVFATANKALDIDETDDLRADVDIAIVDAGVYHEHPDLNVFARTNCSNEAYDPEITTCVNNTGGDTTTHGTHVAGTAAALDNGFGVVGVAPGARIWSVKVLAHEGGFDSWIAAGLDWVTARAGSIEVANLSLGCGCAMPATAKAIEGAVDAGVVVVAAAGNQAIPASSVAPANHPDVITVSAIFDSDGKAGALGPNECWDDIASVKRFTPDDDYRALFSNYGPAVEVTAPGVCILSTTPGTNWAQYRTNTGTSMAAPHVAGAAALLAIRDNPQNAADVEAIADTIIEEGNTGWTEFADPVTEPLLDISNEALFDPFDEPIVQTAAAVDIGSKTATIYAGVNPNGKATTYQFEYGTSTAYGFKAPDYKKPAGSGTSAFPVGEELNLLKPETTYHFRIVATNSDGTSVGKDAEFTTLPADADTEPYITYYTDGSLEEPCPPVSMVESEVSGGCEAEDFQGGLDLGAFMPYWTLVGKYDVDFDRIVVDRNGDGYAIDPTVTETGPMFARAPCDEADGTVIPWEVDTVSPTEPWSYDLEMEITVGMRAEGASPGCGTQQVITVQATSIGGWSPTELDQGTPSANIANGNWQSDDTVWLEWEEEE